jgi:beta-lactam-binding protein with PASTA domain
MGEKLGAGGMAIVHRAQDTLLQRPVTVKVLRGELAADENVVRRFRREAQAAASLSHPNIVGVYDVGRQDEVHYIVMEYVQGKSLKEEIEARGPLPPDEAVRIARQICEALRHAHAHHIIHRDVKPHNVLITPEGRVKVGDFGIAGAATGSTVTYPGALLGTVYYFSPEQAQGKYGDERSDLYALGVVLFEMLTGHVPFEGESPISVALKHIREEPPSPRALNPRIPPAAERVVMKALAKEGERRYQSAADMLRDLEALQRQFAEWRAGRSQAPVPPGASRDRTQVIAAATPVGGEERSTLPGTKTGVRAAAKAGAGGTASGVAPAAAPGQGAREIPGPSQRESQDGGHPPDDYLEFDGGGRTRAPRRGWGLSRPATWIASIAIFLALIGIGLFTVVQWFEVPEVSVPNVVGLSLIEAQSRLAQYRLSFKVVSYDYNVQIPSGQVLDQDPDAGVPVKANRTISLWVSKGPELIAAIPNVTGLNWREAKVTLENAGLVAPESGYSYRTSETVAKDRVISQEPKAGTANLPRGTSASLVVSLGPQAGMVIVPNFIGQTIDQARVALAQLGLAEGTLTTQSSTEPDGTVLSQDPVAGTQAPVGSAVSFTVAGSGGSDPGGGAQPRTESVAFSVPGGKATQNVRILVSDSQGERVVYDQDHLVGYQGTVKVNWTGVSLRVRVYFDGVLAQDYTVTG